MLTSALLSKIPGIQHAFGTCEDPKPPGWDAVRPKFKQVHGTASCEVTHTGQECGEVDALWTQVSVVPIGVQTADCVPILLARQDGTRVAAVHSGWRGTYDQVLTRMWEKEFLNRENASDWVAAIGPSIRAPEYEVDEALYELFVKKFFESAPSEAFAPFRHLDLPLLVQSELQSIGIGQIELLPQTTADLAVPGGNPLFFSHRLRKDTGRQWSWVVRS